MVNPPNCWVLILKQLPSKVHGDPTSYFCKPKLITMSRFPTCATSVCRRFRFFFSEILIGWIWRIKHEGHMWSYWWARKKIMRLCDCSIWEITTSATTGYPCRSVLSLCETNWVQHIMGCVWNMACNAVDRRFSSMLKRHAAQNSTGSSLKPNERGPKLRVTCDIGGQEQTFSI